MEWSYESVIQFLELYKEHRCLWDPNDVNHKNRPVVNTAWDNIVANLNYDFTVLQLKKKKESLMTSYRLNKAKVNQSLKNPAVDMFQPIWYAYALMDSFLGSIYESNQTIFGDDIDYGEIDYLDIPSDSDPLSPAIADESSQDVDVKPKLNVLKRKLNQEKKEKRKPSCSPDLEKKMVETLDILKSIYSQNQNEEDDCGLFAKLLARRLRRLPEDRRDMLIFQIDNLVLKELCS